MAEPTAFFDGVREFAEWCERYHIRFDDYGIRTAEDTIIEFMEWRNSDERLNSST